jgi:hypothetical protein
MVSVPELIFYITAGVMFITDQFFPFLLFMGLGMATRELEL